MSLESLPLELKDQVFSYVLPRDRLSLSHCSTALRDAVSHTHLAPRLETDYYWGQLSNIIFEQQEGPVGGWCAPRIAPRHNGENICISLAVGVELKVDGPPESRQCAIRIRKRLCDRLTVKKVCLINIKYDENTISFIREMLNNCSFEKARIEINHSDHFHPSLVPFINEFSEKVFLSGPLSLIPRLQQLKPLRRFNAGDSTMTDENTSFDDAKLLAIAAAGHLRTDVDYSSESVVTEHGLRTLLMNLASNPRNQLIRFETYNVDNFLRLLGFEVSPDPVGRRGRQRDGEEQEKPQEKDEFLLVPQNGRSYYKQYIVWYRTAALLIDRYSIWAVSHHDRATERLCIPRKDDMYVDMAYVFRKSDGKSISRYESKVIC